MLKGKTAVLFDMDGTLIDSVGVWNEVDRRLLQRLGADDAMTVNVQSRRDEILRKLADAPNPYEAYCSWLGENYRLAMSGAEIMRLRYDIAMELLTTTVDYKPGAPELLERLKSMGLRLIIATTTRGENMSVYITTNGNILTRAPLTDYFEKIYTREDAEKMKPNPEIYFKIMRELKLRTEDCLIFEDSLVGVEAARAAGIEVCAMYDKYSDRDRARINELADYRFDSFFDVIKAAQEEMLNGQS